MLQWCRGFTSLQRKHIKRDGKKTGNQASPSKRISRFTIFWYVPRAKANTKALHKDHQWTESVKDTSLEENHIMMNDVMKVFFIVNLEEMGNWLELARANHVETVVNSQASCGILKCCGWPRRSSEPSSPTNGSEPQILWGLKDIQQSNNSIQKKSEKENLSDINSKDSFRNLQPLILFAVFVGPIISDSALNALWLELFCHRFSSWASGLMPANARAHAGSKWSHPAPIYQSRGHTWCKLPQKSSIQVLEKVTNLVQT